MWFSAGFRSRGAEGWRVAHIMAPGFPQSKRSTKVRAGARVTDRGGGRGVPKTEATVLSTNNLGNDPPLFLLYAVGHINPPWYTVGTNSIRA